MQQPIRIEELKFSDCVDFKNTTTSFSHRLRIPATLSGQTVGTLHSPLRMGKSQRLPPIFLARSILYSKKNIDSIKMRFGYTPSYKLFKFSAPVDSPRPIKFPSPYYSTEIPIPTSTKVALLLMLRKGYIARTYLDYYQALPSSKLTRAEMLKIIGNSKRSHRNQEDESSLDDPDFTTSLTDTGMLKHHGYNTRLRKKP